jgi:TolB-like protein
MRKSLKNPPFHRYNAVIITDLSKISGLSVIARNSVFTYKGKLAEESRNSC